MGQNIRKTGYKGVGQAQPLLHPFLAALGGVCVFVCMCLKISLDWSWHPQTRGELPGQ